MRPHAREQNAGDNDDQRVKKIQRTVPASGFMHDQTDQNQVREYLQGCLQAVFMPQGEQEDVEQRQPKPQNDCADEKAKRQRRGREMGDSQLNGEQEG